jgi:hypothetical protein
MRGDLRRPRDYVQELVEQSTSLVRALPAITDAGETILRVPHSITDENRAQVTSFLDIPLAFAFGESGLADLLSAENHEDQMLVIARAIAYLEIELLDGESSEGR